MQPLRREWAEVRQTVECLLTTGQEETGTGAPPSDSSPAELRKAKRAAESILHQFLVRLQTVKVLDPACGSGNFLYVTLQKLKDLEKEVILFAMDNGLGAFLPLVGPWQLYGIEINPYAFDLAQMTVWIGWLQWIRVNGFGVPAEPILRPLDRNFQCRDAILDLSDPANPKEPDWPKVDFIVGNPPFLGGKFLRRELGDDYVDQLLAALGRPRSRRGRSLLLLVREGPRPHRGGTLQARRPARHAGHPRRREPRSPEAHQGNRRHLLGDLGQGLDSRRRQRPRQHGRVRRRQRDRPGCSTGQAVSTINANLSTATDITQARILPENQGIAFMGDTKVGPFDIPEALAREWLPLRNPNGKSNGDVVRPWANGLEITRTPQRLWIVDFPPG